jgi:hypothetical protein
LLNVKPDELVNLFWDEVEYNEVCVYVCFINIDLIWNLIRFFLEYQWR